MARPSVEAERREQIMAATRRVLVTRGLTLLRVSDVAKAASLSPGIIHYYFDSKEELLRATFDDAFHSSLDRRKSIIAKDEPADVKLHALLRTYVPQDERTVESWHVWLQLWTGALQDPDLRSINERAYGEWRGLIGAVITQGIETGVFACSDTALVVNQLISMIDGLAVQVLLESGEITPDEMARLCDEYVDTLLAVDAG